MWACASSPPNELKEPLSSSDSLGPVSSQEREQRELAPVHTSLLQFDMRAVIQAALARYRGPGMMWTIGGLDQSDDRNVGSG